MSDILIADLHLTDNPLEEYRWKIFDFLEDLKEQHDIENIFLLGDITEKKDHHSAKLVNRVAENLNSLADDVNMLWILRGNHDGIDPEWPYFRFLRQHNQIVYYTEPTFANQGYLFLPHSKDPANEWQDILKKRIQDTNYIFMHQTTFGGEASNGATLAGFDSGIFADFDGFIFSGDIHKPQETGGIIYVGSPYSIYFGDEAENYGAILLDGNKWERIKYESITRRMLDLDFTDKEICDFRMNTGDQFKIRLSVNRSDSDQFDKWKKNLRKYIEEKGGILVSVELKLAEEKSRIVAKRKFKNTDPLTIITRYCRAEGLDEYYAEKGKEFLI